MKGSSTSTVSTLVIYPLQAIANLNVHAISLNLVLFLLVTILLGIFEVWKDSEYKLGRVAYVILIDDRSLSYYVDT